MKVKDLKFDEKYEVDLFQYLFFTPHQRAFSVLEYFLIEKVNSRDYYLYAKKYSSQFPICSYRVSANSDVSELIYDVYKML